MLICSDGGHLAQVLELKELFQKYNYLIITEKTEATAPLKALYNIKYLKPRSKGGKRSLMFWYTLFVNLFLSVKLLLSHFPKVIITTGSHTAVPMCILGKLFGRKIIWVLSFARISTKAKSATLIYPLADKFIVQWPAVQRLYPKSIYLGGIY
ncbi:MAG: PssD/Cps14F family polysaccharide biosynthesis glycosyltransferase [Bacteroidota bacterium]